MQNITKFFKQLFCYHLWTELTHSINTGRSCPGFEYFEEHKAVCECKKCEKVYTFFFRRETGIYVFPEAAKPKKSARPKPAPKAKK